MAAAFPTNQQPEEDIPTPSTAASISAIVVANGSTTTNGGHNKYYVHDYPLGYRFCPTDTELVVHYLMKKIKNEPLPHNKIPNVNLYQYNPYDLTAQYELLGEKEWYFFTPTDRKYRNGKRPNRAADDGYWKATAGDKPIKHKGTIVGLRKNLVFYTGKPKNSNKTNWIMYEYRLNTPRMERNGNNMRLDDWVLCKIYENGRNSKKAKQQEDQDEPVGCSTEILICDFATEDSNPFMNTSNGDYFQSFTNPCNNYYGPSFSVPEIAQFGSSHLPNLSNFGVDHHQQPTNPNFEDQEFSLERQILNSTDNILMPEYLQQQNFDPNPTKLQNYNSCIPSLDNFSNLQNDLSMTYN